MKTCTKETWRLKEAKCQAKDTNKTYINISFICLFRIYINTHFEFSKYNQNTAATMSKTYMINTQCICGYIF